MLTFRAGAAGNGYAAAAMADYLAKVQEIGQRVGLSEYYAAKSGMLGIDVNLRVAELLALPVDRPVSREELGNILIGLRADGAAIPGQQKQKSTEQKVRVAYYDLTFSAPKSVSLAIAFAPTEQERGLLDNCHTDAVASTMRYIETQAAHARRGKGGRKGTEVGNMAWLTFEDFTSRPTIMLPDGSNTFIGRIEVPGDPDRHTHVVLASPVLTASGHVGSVHARAAIAGRVHEYGKIYQAFLATNLRKVGADAVLDQDTGMAKLTDVPRWAVDLFSKRRQEGQGIARKLAAVAGLDWDNLDEKARITFVRQGVSSTRQRKDDGVPDIETWQKQALAANYHHQTVLHAGQEREPADPRQRREAAYSTSLPRLDEQLQRRSKFEGAVARISAVEGLIEHGIVEAGPDIYAITQAYRTEGVLQEGATTALRWGRDIVRDEETGEIHIARFASFTTDAHLRMEQEVVALLRSAGNDKTGELTRAEIDKAADRVARRTGFRLSEPQLRAAYHLGTTGRAAALIGAAGTGKTALYDVLNAAWHAQGATTVGITRAWRQTISLTEAGTDAAHSIRQFIVGMEAGRLSYGSNAVVILDELSQVGTRDLLTIARLQQKHGFRLVATGDQKQGGSIEAGHAERLFELALGEQNVPELTWTRRQERQRDRETALMFRHGRADEALKRKHEDGTLAIVPGGYDDAVRATVDLWFARRSENPGRSLGISAPTNADAMAIGAEIRRREQANGAIKPDWRTLEAIDQRGVQYPLPIAVGDRVRLFQRTRGQFAGGKTAIVGNNGSVVTVEALHNKGVHLRTSKGRLAWVEWSKLRDEETGRVRLSYGDALTIDARQGDTLDEHITALPSGSRAVHGLQAYVAASRHRQREWFVTSQGEELAEIIARRPLGDLRNADREPEKVEQDIIEHMARNMRRQPEKTLATDFLEAARKIGRGTINAGRAAWHRPDRVVEKQADATLQEVAQAVGKQQATIAQAVVEVAQTSAPELWRAKSDLEYWASQVAEGWLEFEDVVRIAYLQRVERAKAEAEVSHAAQFHGLGPSIDHEKLYDQASQEVGDAVLDYEDASYQQAMHEERLRQDEEQEAKRARDEDEDELER